MCCKVLYLMDLKRCLEFSLCYNVLYAMLIIRALKKMKIRINVSLARSHQENIKIHKIEKRSAPSCLGLLF